jgi:hypothetical protein
MIAMIQKPLDGSPREALSARPSLRADNPLVSIIVNNYNYARFLPATLESVLRQTYPRIELIVVDDGSTDGSQEIIRGYGDHLLPLLKQNGGQASAFNAGFACCHGDLVIFLDADDVLLPGAVQRVVEAFQAQPALAKVHYRMAVIDATGQRTGDLKPPPHVLMLEGDLRRHYLAFPDDVWRLPTSGNAYAAPVLRQILPVPEEGYRGGADTYLTHLAPLFGPVHFIDQVCAYYRVHGANNYELAAAELNLVRIRRNVTHALQTHTYLWQTARSLGLPWQPRSAADILSSSLIINRLISLKLDPERHPVQGDSAGRLLLLGIRATRQRFDASLPLKACYICWFLAMVAAPRPLAGILARQMIFPQTRRHVNRLLAFLQRHPRGRS